MLNPVAKNVLETRYLQKDSTGKPIETIPQMWKRIAEHAVKVEDEPVRDFWYTKIYELLDKQYFLFNSPTLVNAGTAINGLSACFVVGMEDSIDGIWNTKRNFAKIAQKGGGCGVNLCDTRPRNELVGGSTHAKAGGPIAWVETLWKDMTAITQSGFRQMACMATMRIDHPDIEDFITCKSPARALASQLTTQYSICTVADAEKIWEGIKAATHLTEEQKRLIKLSEEYLSNFNISISITDDFMRAVGNNDEFDLVFNGKIYKTVSARYLWDLIAENAWASGDPGLFFIDSANNNSPYRYSNQQLKATNPLILAA